MRGALGHANRQLVADRILGLLATHAYLVAPGPGACEHGGAGPHGTPQWIPIHTPAEISDSPLTAPDPARIDAVVANTSPAPDYQRRHLLDEAYTFEVLVVADTSVDGPASQDTRMFTLEHDARVHLHEVPGLKVTAGGHGPRPRPHRRLP